MTSSTSSKRPDWLAIQTIAIAAGSLISVATALYVANRAPIDLPARTRIDALERDLSDIETELRFLRSPALLPAPHQHPGRY